MLTRSSTFSALQVSFNKSLYGEWDVKRRPIVLKMKFTYKIKTRWHDTDASRTVRPSKIVEYMQETANRQCELSNLPLEWMRDEKGLAFILAAISVNIYKPLHAYEDIEVRTWCRESKSFIFNRYFDILRDGEIIAEASSAWVLIDLKSKTMVRAGAHEELWQDFYYDEPIDPSVLLPKARIPGDAILYPVGERRIVYSDIDYNMHMNNTHYPDMICDFLDEITDREHPSRISAMSLSYLKESALGATLTVMRGRADEQGRIPLRTLNESGDTCLEAIVKLIKI